MHVLGLDIGTTGVKSILLDQDGGLKAESTVSYPTQSPKTNWFEQDPEDWWAATATSIKQIVSSSGVGRSEIGGIGLSGQYHGLVLLDVGGKVLRPCIIWNDQRTHEESRYVVEKVGAARLMDIACTRGALYFTACKLLWVRRNEPGVYAKAAKMLLPKDYVRYRLTGEFATDVSDASGTILLNIAQRKWSRELCELLDIEIDLLPSVYESCEPTGIVSKAVARDLGLAESVIVVGGGGDQACAAVGNGITDHGIVGYSVGTSGVIYAATDEPKTDEGGRVDTFCHAVPDRWALLGVTNSAAASLAWFQQTFAAQERQEAERQGRSVFSLLEDKARSVRIGSDRLFFLPYLAGERHPHQDPDARGAFIGLHSGHGLAHAVRAVMEGVAYSFRDCLDIMRGLGVDTREIRGTGGGMKSSLWAEIQANVSGESLFLSSRDEGGAAFGAAILALVGTKGFSSVQEACRHLVRFDREIKPDPETQRIYEQYYQLFCTLYPCLRTRYAELVALP
jgi:xylulokinase